MCVLLSMGLLVTLSVGRSRTHSQSLGMSLSHVIDSSTQRAFQSDGRGGQEALPTTIVVLPVRLEDRVCVATVPVAVEEAVDEPVGVVVAVPEELLLDVDSALRVLLRVGRADTCRPAPSTTGDTSPIGMLDAAW